jgi:hypothetical protein
MNPIGLLIHGFWFTVHEFTVRAVTNREPMNQNGEPMNP